MLDKKRQFIESELRTVSKIKFERQKAMIVCPYHNDRNPSGTVNLDEAERRAPLGWFRCWSCKASKPYNDLALTLGIKPFKFKRETEDDYLDPKAFKAQLLEEDEEDEGFERDYDDLEFKRFPFEEWRGVSVRLLKKVGARYCIKGWTKDPFVWLPVNVNGELRGYVKAHIEKPEPYVDEDGAKVKPTSYVNAPGRWSSEWGLLYFDYSVDLMKRKGLKTMAVCEGPRDSLRLLRYGLPAMSVIGAKNWSENKRLLIEQAGIERVVVFTDGDDAGKDASKLIVKSLKGYVETKRMRLWDWEPGADPFSCNIKWIKKVKSWMV